MAAYQAQTFVFVNIPKMAGKYTTGLFEWARLSYTNHGKGHHTVSESSFGGKPVVLTVRHPVTFLSSLWCHRQNSRKPWQPEEHSVASDNWLEFVDQVCEHPDWIYWWIHRWIDSYENTRIIRMENIWQEWISLWDELQEPYYLLGAEAYRDQSVNRDPHTQQVLAQLDTARIDRIRSTQAKFFDTHGYDTHWQPARYSNRKKIKGVNARELTATDLENIKQGK